MWAKQPGVSPAFCLWISVACNVAYSEYTVDMRLTEQGKIGIIIMSKSGFTKPEIARLCKVHRSTIYRILQKGKQKKVSHKRSQIEKESSFIVGDKAVNPSLPVRVNASTNV